MRKIILALFSLLWATSSFGYEPQNCREPYTCAAEKWTEPYRADQPIRQPEAAPVMGSCGALLPIEYSYRAVPTGVSCGAGVPNSVNRLPLPVDPEVENQWDIYLHSGMPDAQSKAQQVRQQDYKWTKETTIPMQESWSYTVIVGGYSQSRCEQESYTTTCTIERTEAYDCSYPKKIYKDVDDYEMQDQCDSEPAPSYPSSSGRSSYGSDSDNDRNSTPYQRDSTPNYPSRPSDDRPSPPSGDTGHGENLGVGDWDEARIELPKTPIEKFVAEQNIQRAPAGCRKVKVKVGSHKEYVRTDIIKKTCSREADPLVYSCRKTRPVWCTWPETRSAHRSCPSQKLTYTVNYIKDPNWKPGYIDKADPTRRSYNDLLPNKWDLLPGESEIVTVQPNAARDGSYVIPEINFKNGLDDGSSKDHTLTWNEYTYDVNSLRCIYGQNYDFNIDVTTVGRNFQKAPNPLKIVGLTFENANTNRPSHIDMIDESREKLLQAADISRNFGRAEGTDGADPNAVYKDKDGNDVKGTSASGGYWFEARFKMQLLRKDKWNRWVRVTLPNTFSSEVGDVMGNSLHISLEGRDGLDRFYRPGGPLEFILGNVYKAFGVELTPGEEYFIKMQTVSRGLPFYESGCKGGKAICEGEEASKDSYSDPVYYPMTADKKIDTRSGFKVFKDIQEFFMLF